MMAFGSGNTGRKFGMINLGVLRLGVTILLMMHAHAIFAQETAPELHRIDSITWAHYSNGEWSQLIDEGTKAINEGIDYFYLRMRVGIAFYEMKNYRRAIPHFKKAKEFNPPDKSAVEYLYLSYLLGGRPQDAQKIIPELGKAARERLAASETKIVEEIYIEGGPAFAGNQNLGGNQKGRHRETSDTIYNGSYYYDNVYYGHAGLRLRLHPAVSLYQGYSYVEAPFTEKISYMGEAVPDFQYSTKQHEYYANLSINLPGKILATPAFHMLWLEYALRVDMYDPEIDGLVYDTVYENEQMYVASLSLKKDISIFAVEAGGTYGDFGHMVHKQLSLAGYVYPFGNLDLYAKTGITHMWNENEGRWIFHQMVGWSPVSGLWLEGSGTFGQLQDYAEQNAFIIYNAPEEIIYKIEGTVMVEVSSKIELSMRYRLLERVNRYLAYTSYEDFTFEYTNYHYHTLIGGIKWKF